MQEYPIELVAQSEKKHYLCGFPPFDLDVYEKLVKEYKLDQ